MRKRLLGGLTAAVLAAGLAPQATVAQATPVFKGKEDRAEAAVASAQGKLDTNEKQGISADAADPQARARTALAEAARYLREDNEDHAYHAAQEAIALADLATATAELKRLTAERDRLKAQ